ncbi:MAG: M15 family metallopeptidase [Bacteroidota bacterium]
MNTRKIILVLGICFFSFATAQKKNSLPEGFVYVEELIPDLKVELRYYSTYNFIGDTIDGYKSNKLILSKPAAEALKMVHSKLQNENLCLLVFDGYRPQRAVNHFVRWAKDLADTINKQQFYPKVEKRHLFKSGYIASKSGHSRGSTVDLTIIDGNTGEPLDMGSPFDYFGEVSWVAHPHLTEVQRKNRMKLQQIMRAHNFRGYSKEWWHFTLQSEPFPKQYFDFLVE